MSRVLQYIFTVLVLAAVPVFFFFTTPRESHKPLYDDAPLLFDPIEEAPNPFRKFLWLNGEWQFRLPDGGGWRTVAIPHVWNSIPGLENYVGPVEYQLEFEFPEDWNEGKIFFHFGAVTGMAEIRLNGELATRRWGRYTPFEVDVTAFCEFEEKNLIEIRVDNTPDPEHPHFWLEEKNFGGIFREAYIEQRKSLYFQDVRVETVSVEEATATLQVTASIEMADYQGILVFGKIERPDRKDPIVFDTTVTADEAGNGLLTWKGNIGNISLWSPENPAMYSLSMVAIHEDGTADGIKQAFGIRDFGRNNDGKYVLNGLEIQLRGVVWREQLPGGWGPVLSESVLREDFERIRAAGFNAVRFSHPVHPAVLDLCDREGFFVVEELPFWKKLPPGASETEYLPELEERLREMIARDRHHPSIIAWGLGSDLRSDDEAASRAIARLADVAGEEDASRPVYAGFLRSGARTPDASVQIRAVSLKADRPSVLISRLKRFSSNISREKSELPIFVVSYGTEGVSGSGNAVGLHGTEMNQLYLIKSFENQIVRIPRVQGWFIDSFADYEGPFVDPRGVNNIVRKGLMTADREPKLAYEHIAGLAESEIEWKWTKLKFRFPGAEFVILLVLGIVFFGAWSGFGTIWTVFIEPDLLWPAGGEMKNTAGGFLIFGLPMILMAALAASFSIDALLTVSVLDPVDLPQLAIKSANLWLDGFWQRLLILIVGQLILLLAAALLMSVFLGGEPLRIFELLARTTVLRILYVLIPFLPLSPWILIFTIAAWECVMQVGLLARSFTLSSLQSALLVILSHSAVAVTAVAIAIHYFGTVDFLF